jgi:hypothetical protein
MDQLTPVDPVQIRNPLFNSHMLNEEGVRRAHKIAVLFDDLLESLRECIYHSGSGPNPTWEGREWSLVQTKLEEASFFAKKAMAVRPENTSSSLRSV